MTGTSCDNPFEKPGEPEHGTALVVVLLALLVVSTISVAMIFTSQAEHLTAANERDAERALLAAEAGIHYAYRLYTEGLIHPTTAGSAFDSFAAAVSTPLKGAAFTGFVFDASSSASHGQLYRIESTGTYRRANRTTELVFQIVPEAFRFGYMGFNEVKLHNHSGNAGPSFKVESTIFSNGQVEVPDEITLDGSIVAADTVKIKENATVKRDVFANAIDFNGSGQTVMGDVKLLTAVEDLPSAAVTWDRVDNHGDKYAWFDGHSSPGTVSGSGTILGTQSSHTIQDHEVFRTSIFRRDGRMLANPDLNVVKFVAPPMLNYQAMKAEADKHDATYFTSETDAMTYLASKKVVEVIDGKTLTTIKVGTPSDPEFLYIDDDFVLELTSASGAESPSAGRLEADGLHIEGGIYVSGDFEFNGEPFDPALHPAPPDYYQLKINALPHCFPAIVAYPEPTGGTIGSWAPNDTPAMSGGQSKIKMSSRSPHEGFVYVHGVVYSEGETHLHHTKDTDELIRFIGAELAYTVHNCDYFWFTYDPDVLCTRFLVAEEGYPQIISHREVR